MLEGEQDEVKTGDDHEAPEEGRPATPDEVLYFRVHQGILAYSTRQGEILRLAQYIHDRATEIDDAKRRARELIQQRIAADVDESAVDKLLQVMADIDAELGPDDLSDDEKTEAIQNALHEVAETLPDGAMSTYLESVAKTMGTPAGVGMLHSSLLVALVSELEMLISVIARALFERNPGTLDDSERKFTWSTVASFDSLDDFRDHVVDRAVEDLLRGSLEDWMQFFEKKFKLSVPSAAREFAAVEAVQRRHVIAHNAGFASSRYLDQLKRFNVEAELDDALTVDFEYLQRAATELFVIGYGLAIAAGIKYCRDEEITDLIEREMADRTFYMLQDRRFNLVAKLAEAMQPERFTDDGRRLVVRVNQWLALKELGRFEECRADVEAMDVRSRSNDFVLAKHALLDEDEAAHDLAQKMMKDSELKRDHWLTWPLLRGARNHAERILREGRTAGTDAA